MLSGALLLCGSRGLLVSPRDLVPVARALCPGGWLVLSGGARGVDSAAPALASMLGWHHAPIRPEYGIFGRSAPLARDDELVALCSCVLAVWDGRSRGTAYTLARAAALGRPIYVLRR